MGQKRYNQKDGVGKSKYVISYHDGKKKHKDGSDFFDIQIFRNKKDLAKFVNTLHKGGYKYGFDESVSENFTPEQAYNGLFRFKYKGKKYVGQVARKDGGKYVLSLHDIGLLSIPDVSPNDMEYLGNVSDQGKKGLPYLSAHPKNFQKVQNGQFYKELVFKGGVKASLPSYISNSQLKDVNKYYRLKLTKDDLKIESVNEGYGEWVKAKNLTDIIKLSKQKKNATFYVTDDNNSRIGTFYLKNGKFAKATTANPNYDLQRNKTKLKDRSDVIYKYKVDESSKYRHLYYTNESKTKESKVIQKIYQYTKTEKKFYDELAKHEVRIGQRDYAKFIIMALKGFGINPREYKRIPDAEEKLYQIVSK